MARKSHELYVGATVAEAFGGGSDAKPHAFGGVAARFQSFGRGVVVVGEVAEEDMRELRVDNLLEKGCRLFIVEMPVVVADAGLEKFRIVSVEQHRQVVVALYH